MRFSKMHGLGNDFVIIDSITQKVYFNSDKIRSLSNRFYGIGFDQLLVVEPPYDPNIDFHCRIYNADGSEVYQCGNGIRCVARFVCIKKLTNKQHIKISTDTYSMMLSVLDSEFISVNMGEPIFDPIKIPFFSTQYQKMYVLFVPNFTILCGVVSIGNPHCVILVEQVDLVPVTVLGSILENHHCFPKKANISFMQIISQNNIKLRVYERGSGETKACGSAACAAVAIGIQQGLLKKNISVQVNLPGGDLFISWKGLGYPLYMIGSATYIYDGCINL
ncbi:diaminopimelate epimerase [Candidatus Blochmanniella floridana]|uniref:Diaminopimelate epimerase n=1 Tax=Blochmanniella floridana TaxID=203907 RepID=DAPF_BLOFL|nr:RecName: Full=Diaminopimelate epimerase; Short=DAP epimerase; AltName: Full=PLP-independent amino acid racemase [Candidatus Blochmannia floridanus]CAD83261.1 diaminopimelate epimerase [Candidatus Blochmannia floridanus]